MSLAAGALAVCLSGAAIADDAQTVSNTLQVLGAFADATGQGEFGDVLTMAGVMVAASDTDPQTQADKVNGAIARIKTDLTVVSQKIDSLRGAQTVEALAIARTWDAGMLSSAGEKMDLLRSSLDEVLIPLGVAPTSQRDAPPNGPSRYGVYGNAFHLAAFGVATATMAQAGDFLDIRYLPHGGGCLNHGAGTSDIVGDCSPNQLWIAATAVPQKVEDRDDQGLLKSYGMIDGAAYVPAYRFRPEIGLASYFAELRVAITAMETDLGGVDMTSAAARSDTGKVAYFQARYAQLFARHIAFLSYLPLPDDPSPDGLGSTDYIRYATHANTSLSNSYALALRRKDSGVTPAVWETIDRMRDLLTYASVHGGARGWVYVRPRYIAAAESPPGGSTSGPGHGGSRSNCLIQNCDALKIPASVMVGLKANGDAFEITVHGDQMSVGATPIWAHPGVKYLIADSAPATIVSTTDSWMFARGAGGATTALGSDVIEDMYSSLMFGGGDDIVYFVEKNGDLYWMRRRPSTPIAPVKVGNGWGDMRAVVGAGQGVIYAVEPNGDLLCYLHDGYFQGVPKWHGPAKVAKGWDKYIRVVANPNGVLIAISADGSADLYQYLDYDSGRSSMADPPAPNRQAGRLLGPFPLSGVDLNEFPLLTGELYPTANGVVK